MPPLKTSSSNLTLTYDAIDILGDNDKSLFLHKRPLLNADTMVKKGLFKSALEIYYRAVSKISNPEIQKKIQKNISDIHSYLKTTDPDSEKVFLEKYADNREKEFNESLKELTENLSDSLTEKLNILKQIETVPEREEGNSALVDETQKHSKKDESEIKPLDLGSLDTKPKQEIKQEEIEEESEEIEGTLEYEKDESIAGKNIETEKQIQEEDSSKKSKEKKPKKANIKVKKDPESEATNIETDSTDIQMEKADIRNESAEFKSDKSEITNQSAEIKSETSIQNASLESDSIQVENQNISSGQQFPQITPQLESGGISSSDKSELPSSETIKSDSKPVSTESKIVEEIRVIKEYKEDLDSPPLTTESKISESIIPTQSSESKHSEVKTQSFTDANLPVSKTQSTTEEIEQLLLPLTPQKSDIETGWSELETEAPKPKADKDYAPLMKKYEAGNIEIPESTEFITGEFIPKESSEREIQAGKKTDTPSSGKENQQGTSFSGGIKPGMLQGIPSDKVSIDPNNFDTSQPSFNTEQQSSGTSQTSFETMQQGSGSHQQNFDSSQQAFNPPPLPPPLPLNINDWLSNLFFSKEWEKFKPLPMKERRSGRERRSSQSNQLPKGIKKDRRSGLDRRNQNANLLHEREAFLKDWNKDNQNYTPSLSQMLGNIPQHTTNLPASEGNNLFTSSEHDPSLKSLEFLPRDPSSTEKLPLSEDLVKVELPEPEEIILKPPIDQNEVKKEEVANDISKNLSTYVPANEELGLPESDKGLVKIDLPDPVLLKAESAELPHREVSGEIEVSSKDGTGIVGDSGKEGVAKDTSGMGHTPYTPEAYQIPEELRIELPDPDDYLRTKSGHLIDPFAPEETPEINMIEGDGPLPSEEEGAQISEIPELPPPPPEPERTIHGILELKPPEIDDAPFLTLTYDFSKIPHPFKLSKNYSIMEYSYYKYKPMLMKAQEFARRKMLKNALNYYRVIKSQNIPPELKNMINRNITDITEFLEKFIMSKGGG